MLEGLLEYWKAGDIEAQEGTNKIFYRTIGAYKFQFRKIGYRERTSLLIDIAAVSHKATLLIDRAINMLEPKDAKMPAPSEAEVAMTLLPDIIVAFATTEGHALLNKLCDTVAVDLGNGKYESLSDLHVAEQTFGPDLTLQMPVALSAALVNLDTVMKQVTAI